MPALELERELALGPALATAFGDIIEGSFAWAFLPDLVFDG